MRLAPTIKRIAPVVATDISPVSLVPKRTRFTAAGPNVRSAVSGVKATVFGAYGFVGRYVVGLLAASGTQCVIPFRGDDMEFRHLRVMGDHGVVVPMPFSPRDEDSVRRAIAGSDVVINLIGKEYETSHFAPWMTNYSFRDMNVKIADRISRIAVEEGVQNLVHVSALAADHYSISEWARTKAEGEEVVRRNAPGATIIRPADVFGAEDRFLNMYAQMYQKLPRVPLVDAGTAHTQPLFVEDLAKAIYRVAQSTDPEVMLSQTYDLAGPEEYTHREILEYVFETVRAINPSGSVANISPAVADLLGRLVEIFPYPLISRDKLLRMQSDVVLNEGAPTKRLHDLGIEATSMEMPHFNFLHRYRSGSHFLDILEGKTH